MSPKHRPRPPPSLPAAANPLPSTASIFGEEKKRFKKKKKAICSLIKAAINGDAACGRARMRRGLLILPHLRGAGEAWGPLESCARASPAPPSPPTPPFSSPFQLGAPRATGEPQNPLRFLQNWGSSGAGGTRVPGTAGSRGPRSQPRNLAAPKSRLRNNLEDGDRAAPSFASRIRSPRDEPSPFGKGPAAAKRPASPVWKLPRWLQSTAVSIEFADRPS